MKIVINDCHGGFGLSKEAMMLYGELAGITLYPVDQKPWSLGIVTYWTVPEDQRVQGKSGHEYVEMSFSERIAHNEAISKQQLWYRDIERNDPLLVQVVETLGSKANGRHADLKVVDIPDGVEWQIEEYDGSERIAEVHRTWC